MMNRVNVTVTRALLLEEETKKDNIVRKRMMPGKK